MSLYPENVPYTRTNPIPGANRLDRSQLAEILRMERARRSLSLRTVAHASGVSISAISELENAKRDPRLDSVRNILDAYGLELVAVPIIRTQPKTHTPHKDTA